MFSKDEAFSVALELSSKETKHTWKQTCSRLRKKNKILFGTLYRHVVESAKDWVVEQFKL